MSGFKTKKLPQTQKSITPVREEIITPSIPKQRSKMVRWVIALSLGIAVIIFGGVFAINQWGSYQPQQSTPDFQPISEIAGEILSQKKEGTINILIAGIGGRGHEGSDLTDSIMLASLNGDEKRVTLLSIPRDLYVSYPKNTGAGRINSLYGIGKSNGVGIKYLADKVAEITGQQIDHYLVIDFSGFKKIIDTLGGVEIDVPEELIDREYPDENWGYETLVVRKGLQMMDGSLALKYARSRHSTSDFDRSNRQQLIIKAIKEKLLSSEMISSPTKISGVFATVMSHLDTDLSLTEMAELAYGHRSVQSNDIRIFSLNNECNSLRQCHMGSYLYTPSRDLFGGASVVIPENARVNKLSYYDDIRRFVDMMFRFPSLSSSNDEIILISRQNQAQKAKNLGMSLSKMGFKISTRHPTVVTTGSIMTSHINVYWHSDIGVGIRPDSPSLEGLKYLESSIPVITVTHNEYITDDGPKIEIVLGDDMEKFFPFAKSAYYIPSPPSIQTGSILSGEQNTKISVSGEKRQPSRTPVKKVSHPASVVTPSESSLGIQPGQWEEFGN